MSPQPYDPSQQYTLKDHVPPHMVDKLEPDQPAPTGRALEAGRSDACTIKMTRKQSLILWHLLNGYFEDYEAYSDSYFGNADPSTCRMSKNEFLNFIGEIKGVRTQLGDWMMRRSIHPNKETISSPFTKHVNGVDFMVNGTGEIRVNGRFVPIQDFKDVISESEAKL